MTFAFRKMPKGATSSLDPRTRRALNNLAMGSGDTPLMAELFDGQYVVIKPGDSSIQTLLDIQNQLGTTQFLFGYSSLYKQAYFAGLAGSAYPFFFTATGGTSFRWLKTNVPAPGAWYVDPVNIFYYMDGTTTLVLDNANIASGVSSASGYWFGILNSSPGTTYVIPAVGTTINGSSSTYTVNGIGESALFFFWGSGDWIATKMSGQDLYPNSLHLDDRSTTNGVLTLGTGYDAAIYYDGTDLVLDALYGATSTVQVKGAMTATGLITGQRVKQSASSWEDGTFGASRLRPGSASPTWAKHKDNGSGSTGVGRYYFDKTTVQSLEAEWQLPHSWVAGTNIEFHVHWFPKATWGTGEFVRWGIEYYWANTDGVIGNTTIAYSDASTAATATTKGDTTLIADTHYITEVASISGAGKTISSAIVFRIFRDAGAATDDYPDDAGFLFADFHYEKRSLGSDTEYL